MGQRNRAHVIAGHYEPSMRAQFLPACAFCGVPHPAAHPSRPLDQGRCPACGAFVPSPPAPIEVPAVITGGGFGLRIGVWLLKAAAALIRFAKGIDP